MISRKSAREAQQTLFYVQAVDQAKSVIPETNRAGFYEDFCGYLAFREDQAACACGALPLGHESQVYDHDSSTLCCPRC